MPRNSTYWRYYRSLIPLFHNSKKKKKKKEVYMHVEAFSSLLSCMSARGGMEDIVIRLLTLMHPCASSILPL